VDELLQFLIAGLKNGSIYALVALGFTIVFAATGAINFAQGEFFMLGGMLGVFFAGLGLPLPMAAVAAIAATAAIGGVFELLAVRPISRGDPLRIIMVTIGGSVVLRQLALHLFGPDERALAPFTRGPSIKLARRGRRAPDPVDLGCSRRWPSSPWRCSTAGPPSAGRCAPPRSRRDAARLVGVNAGAMVTASFALAAALGAVGGLVVAPLTQTAFDVGAGMGVKGFAAAILGGLGNPVAAVGGGLVLGLLESLTAGYLDPLYKDAVALVVLLVVLFVRPQGLLGGSGRVKM
jgi:branched-chain amino acid transport system permease protein